MRLRTNGRLAPGSGGSVPSAAGSARPEAAALAELACRSPTAMSSFDTNPFADPVDVNPFQVELTTLNSLQGRGPPPGPLPPSPWRRRDGLLAQWESELRELTYRSVRKAGVTSRWHGGGAGRCRWVVGWDFSDSVPCSPPVTAGYCWAKGPGAGTGAPLARPWRGVTVMCLPVLGRHLS